MKFILEHRFPRRLRYARLFFAAGSAELFFSLDGSMADWHASIGRRKREVSMSDKEYTRYRETLPAVGILDDDGRTFVVRNAAGYEEQWERPHWSLTNVRRNRPHKA